MTTLKDLLNDLTINVMNVYENTVAPLDEKEQTRQGLVEEYIEIIKERLIG